MEPPYRGRDALIAVLVLILSLIFAPKAHAEKPQDWKEPTYIKVILNKAGDTAGLPIGLAHCVAYSESRFIPTARSRVVDGYRSDGLMQIYRKYMYGGNGMIAKFSSYSQSKFNWKDPAMNATLGCNYLAYLIDRFGGSVYLGILAYNFGETNLANLSSWDQVPANCIAYADEICRNLDNWDESW